MSHVEGIQCLLVNHYVVGCCTSDVGVHTVDSLGLRNHRLNSCIDVRAVLVSIQRSSVVERLRVDAAARTLCGVHLQQVETLLQAGNGLVHVERVVPALGTCPRGLRTIHGALQRVSLAASGHLAFPTRLEVIFELGIHEQVCYFRTRLSATCHS